MYLYPKEIMSDVYVTKLGGFSYEIESSEIGINAKAIEINTSIIANETLVKIRFFGDTKPYFLRKAFRVVGVSENMDCYELTKNGELVLPEEYEDEFKSKEGEDVIINTVEFFRIDGDYSRVINAFKIAWSLENQAKRN